MRVRAVAALAAAVLAGDAVVAGVDAEQRLEAVDTASDADDASSQGLVSSQAQEAQATATETVEQRALDNLQELPEYKKPFMGQVIVPTNFESKIHPMLSDLSYEESTLRASVGQAIEDTLKAEAPKLKAKLEAEASKAGKAAASAHVQPTATAAVKAALDKTDMLLAHKAVAVCQGLSRQRSLPQLCASEARKELAKTYNAQKAGWGTAAAKAARADTEAAASAAALDAVSDVVGSKAPPEAYHHARVVFEKELAAAQKKYTTLLTQQEEGIAAHRSTFWKKAKTALSTKIAAEVKKAIWDAPMTEATPKLEAAATKAAADVSLRAISATLAPQFGAAARTALETGVREATKKAMGSWKPSWSGGSTSLEAAGGLENDQSTASWDWGA